MFFIVFVVGNCDTENKQAYKKIRATVIYGAVFLDPILKQDQKSHFIILDEKRVNLIDFVVSKQIFLYMFYHMLHCDWSANQSIITFSRSLLP